MRVQINQLKIWVQTYFLNWKKKTNIITLLNNFKSSSWCTARQSIFFSRFSAIVIKFFPSMVPSTKIVKAKHKQKIIAVLIINSCCFKIPAQIKAIGTFLKLLIIGAPSNFFLMFEKTIKTNKNVCLAVSLRETLQGEADSRTCLPLKIYLTINTAYARNIRVLTARQSYDKIN